MPKPSLARLEKGSPEAKAYMKGLSERAAAVRKAKSEDAKGKFAPPTLTPDINEFTGQTKSNFTAEGTFFNPHVVFDPRMSFGAPFPPEVK